MKESYDVLVIGAGPGGYVAAIRASQLGLKTAIVEKEGALGGTCLNVGCIPSKTLLHFSEVLQEVKEENTLFSDVEFSLSSLMNFKGQVILGLTGGIGHLLNKNKVKKFKGVASFINEESVEIKEEDHTLEVEAKYFIIATGSKPKEIKGLPFDENQIVSSTGALSLKEVPKRLLVVGAGVIGLELGSVYSRMGSEVTFIEFLPQIAAGLEDQLSKTLKKSLENSGMKFHLSSKVLSAEKKENALLLHFEKEGKKETLEGDVMLVCVGGEPYTLGLGLEKAGLKVDEKGRLPIDTQFRTQKSHIFAIGDVVEGPMLAHKASEEGVAVAELIAGLSPQVNYMAITNVLYTFPEVASVGLTEVEAKNKGIESKVGVFPFLANSRAHCIGSKEGFVKVVVESTSDIIIGLHIIAPYASELIAVGVIAIQKKITAKELSSFCFAHPTFSEAIKEACLAVHKETIHI